MHQVLIHQKLAKKADLASLKLDIDKIDIDKLEKVPSGLNSLKNKIVKLDVDKLKSVPTDLKKLIDVVDKEAAKKMCMINWLKKLMPLIQVDLL